MAAAAGHKINIGPYGKMFKCFLLLNYALPYPPF
jgi:hypothetical protein